MSCAARVAVEVVNFGAALLAGNKRLELAGGLLALLFEDLFKRCAADTYIAVWLGCADMHNMHCSRVC